ncbi:FIST C-terminal domain-containing protein [Lutibacter sp. TH_r2]|uniref:FIST signal transduction protein n=1 Tax=Lutibacter sp. TH_r2 TaxID=3082083 RepID=UPI0029534305|nr:FIST N-terminal domain-containing protein [Lutibacter sp. TH_r2]MDV7186829.1 FIST C-terminal domain-containing protein [Lutibacter sp. TH_r2]
MKIIQAKKTKNANWEFLNENTPLNNPLVFVFGDRLSLENLEIIEDIKNQFPYEHLVFGSTAGEIMDEKDFDESIVVTAMEFEKSSFKIKKANILDFDKDAEKLGKHLIEQLPQKNLKHIFVLSEGSFVNGSALIKGLESTATKAIITGGLCGDGALFEKTVASYKTAPKPGEVIVIGFYGDTLEISFASVGGWKPFGPERIITKSTGNILYEIDNQPALDLYSKYLGDKASELPQASLFYPLKVKEKNQKNSVVRTILSINTEDNSMVLAGNVPENAKVQLMMSSVDELAGGAYEAAKLAMKNRKKLPEIGVLVSCIGRKLAMDQRVEEEIEDIKILLDTKTKLVGFYSYGEIAPFHGEKNAILHNQTMTLTLISE